MMWMISIIGLGVMVLFGVFLLIMNRVSIRLMTDKEAENVFNNPDAAFLPDECEELIKDIVKQCTRSEHEKT